VPLVAVPEIVGRATARNPRQRVGDLARGHVRRVDVVGGEDPLDFPLQRRAFDDDLELLGRCPARKRPGGEQAEDEEPAPHRYTSGTIRPAGSPSAWTCSCASSLDSATACLRQPE
jgi:hypothetical protein